MNWGIDTPSGYSVSAATVCQKMLQYAQWLNYQVWIEIACGHSGFMDRVE